MPSSLQRKISYQVQNTGRSSLVLSALSEEEETLAGDAGPGSVGVGHIRLLAVEIGREMLVSDGLLSEPEELLREPQAPETKKK